ncbi:hypothetical protein [Pareuzebyella sediminis]|uniref:hypothetical protein n=1 Tax=Pareuzebyella sediminis TaxID=2607998 RepID=UPI0011EE0155|nr:hypothetical protein [Pareuzebyella sediminis]
MKHRYLGCITEPVFIGMNEEEQNAYLLDKKLYDISYSSSFLPTEDEKVPGRIYLGKLGLNEKNKYHIPSIELANCLYEFILYKYEAYLNHAPTLFKARFDDLTFGVSKKKKRKIALDEFNRVYKETSPDAIDSLNNRFQALHSKREGLKNMLANERSIVLAYLIGNQEFFDLNTYDRYSVIPKIIGFEGQLKILLGINNNFLFEEETFFSEKNDFRQIYDIYETLFKNFDAFRFNYTNLEKLEHAKPSYVDSLFEVLQNNLLITGSKKAYREYVLEVHEIRLSKIRDYHNLVNDEHDKRVAKYQNDWENFLKISK